MRSILARGLIPFGALLLVSSVESSAHARETVISRGGTPWIRLGGAYAASTTTDVETRGRAILTTQVKVAPSTLVKTGVDRFGDGETIVRFGQSHRGLPVIGRGASVRLSASGQPIATVTDLEADLPSSVAAVVTPEHAASLASSSMIIRATANESHLVVWPTLDRGARVAYAVIPHVPLGVPTRPRVIVDAETGEVLEARDLVTFAKASTYQFNPTKTPKFAPAELALSPTGSTLSNPFIESTNCIDKKTVKPVNMFGFDLKVHICDLEQVATANVGSDFVYEPSDVAGSVEARSDAFSEVSIYYHTAKAYSFFRTLQGDPEAQVVVDKPLRLIANLQVPAGMTTGDMTKAANPDIALDTFQNAFFSPANGGLGAIFQQLYGFDAGALWFGQGPKRDYAYDGDVVYHEFGHAVVDNTIKLGAWHVDERGAIDAPGAMNEGLADYFSSAITGDPDVGEYAAVDLGAAAGSVIRTLANQDKCPSAVTGEVHFDSTLFSGGLWQARQSLAEGDRSKFDAAMYKALRSHTGNGDLGFGDLSKLFLATLQTDLPAGATALEKVMTERGVLPSCERILSFEGTLVSSPYKRAGFVAPGKQTVNVKGTAPGIIQVRAALPPNTATVTVSFVVRPSGGSQSPLGGNAKPFTPVVLAKLGAPITWNPKSAAGHDADTKAAPAAAKGSTSATIDIPEDATADSIYVQIASTGDSDGAYDSIALSFTPREVAGGDEVPPPATVPATVTTTESACSASNARANAAVFPGLLAAAAALTLARRRRSSSR